MKKGILLLITAIIMVTLVSCSKGKKVTVAVSVTPHSEVLEFIKPKMKEKGYDLEIMIVKDVVTANMALKEDSIDANYIQHRGTLERFNKEQNANFVEVTGVHLEPFGMYSKKVKNAAKKEKTIQSFVASLVIGRITRRRIQRNGMKVKERQPGEKLNWFGTQKRMFTVDVAEKE